MKNYILITPVKNEEKYLPITAKNVFNQTIPPIAWVIIDGNSVDSTLKIVSQLCKKYNWIYSKKQEMFSCQKNHLNFAYGVYEGYEYAKKVCEEKGLDFEYVAKIDADVLIPPYFFERLLEKFELNSSLGVASGQSYNLIKEFTEYTYANIDRTCLEKNNYIFGELPDKRMYRKKFLDEVGGFPISKYSPDTILLAKLKLKKWDVKIFNDVSIYNLRENTGTIRNIWESSKIYGKNRYYLNYNPLVILGNVFVLILNRNLRSALAYSMGYLSSILHRDPQIDDNELKHYFMYKRPIEIINSLFHNPTN